MWYGLSHPMELREMPSAPAIRCQSFTCSPKDYEMPTQVQRRSVLRAAAVAAVGVAASPTPSLFAAAGPSEKLNVAFIGVGGRGRANVGALADQNMVAFADVDDQRAGSVFQQYPNVQRFRD